MNRLIDLLSDHAGWLAALVATALILAVIAALRGRSRPIYPFAAKPVLTGAELNFYRTLIHCVPDGTTLMCKVRFADFLEVTLRGNDYLKHFGRISQKHADFLLIDSGTSAPRLVIELDDSTHRANRRTMESDTFKNAALRAAAVPILRVNAKRNYDRRELERQIVECLGTAR